MKVEFLPAAVQELHDAFEWYQDQSDGLGYEFLAEVDTAARLLASWPNSWSRLTGSLRRCLIRRFPYGLIYGVDGDVAIIVAVAHLHRKPFYWMRRSPKRNL